MEGSGWRPAQGDPGMASGDWRSELSTESRQRIVNKMYGNSISFGVTDFKFHHLSRLCWRHETLAIFCFLFRFIIKWRETIHLGSVA